MNFDAKKTRQGKDLHEMKVIKLYLIRKCLQDLKYIVISA